MYHLPTSPIDTILAYLPLLCVPVGQLQSLQPMATRALCKVPAASKSEYPAVLHFLLPGSAPMAWE